MKRVHGYNREEYEKVNLKRAKQVAVKVKVRGRREKEGVRDEVSLRVSLVAQGMHGAFDGQQGEAGDCGGRRRRRRLRDAI